MESKLTSAVLSEADIAGFCNNCDNLGMDNICIAPPGNEGQIQYVQEGSCYWAKQNKVEGQITAEDGFVPL